MTKTTKELLQDRKAELEAEIAAVEAKTAPLRDVREKLRERMAPLEAEIRQLNQQIKALEQPHLSELKLEYADVARALGSKRMRVGAGEAKTEG